MADEEVKTHLRRYLQDARESLLWKARGASEYDVRRPLVPTGSNLLGIVKHLAVVEIGYFGDTFGRHYEGWVARFDDESEPNADMWATAEESSEQIVEMYRSVWIHSDATIEELPLDALGRVPWWPQERAATTLGHILVRVTAETNRHAGQADILRELIDGSAGWVEGNENLPTVDAEWWEAYRAKLEDVARGFAAPS
jgi:uncharacterized damage-inducible protein DinB